VIAGGADDDVIFGQLGDDTLHGDGQITLEGSVYIVSTLTTTDSNSDIGGDDYVEGNGGDDTIYGGLGQDDLIGGNSTLFGLDSYGERPDGSDTIYGGNGDMLARNNLGNTDAEGHARDADMILGDNGNIYRLVGTNSLDSGKYLTFNYDNYGTTLKIVPRAAEMFDYTPGGPDYNPDSAATDIGASDLILGESGDDFIYGMVGGDALYGNAQDDDLIGGYGNDWISGGTGDDGVLGDDGRIYTSRNSTTGEPLYGVAGLLDHDPDARFNNGTVLDEFIYTPGKIQQMTINVTGELKKSVNLTPFNLDPLGVDGGIQDPLYDPELAADDIIYGGWGDDFLHGGAGDDAISGAEALQGFYGNPVNDADVLEYSKNKVGEFALYDEYDALKKIEGFLLNFDATEGPISTGTMTDGNDAIFGDLGNDWIVGGTGRDHLYGGWGDDLLNADDNLETAGGLNNAPDTDATYEDLAYGGAGRDVLIANTGGDRLIDWVGEFNSYLVPFAPYGIATISRTVQPQLPEYLYALSMSDGVDMTRAADTGADALRNGEPEGELGLIRQKDSAWHDQTGAPADPQAGNIPGGSRDVLRSASFNTGTAESFAVDSGVWTVTSGRFQVAPESLGGDALAVFNVDKFIPNYFEMTATIRAVKPVAGYGANAYLVFDYQSATDFKFAGINISTSKLEMGYRDATGWHVTVQAPYTGALKVGTDYNVLLALNGSVATLVVQNRVTLTHTFAPRVDEDGFQYFLNEGMVGIGANNAKGELDNVVVQRLAPETTLERTVTFSGEAADQDVFGQLFTAPDGGNWQVAEGLYTGVNSIDLVNLNVSPAYLVTMNATLQTGARGGFAFDYYGPEDYKFVVVSVETGQVLLGHSTARTGWVIDTALEVSTLIPAENYSLAVTLMGNTVSVTFNDQAALSFGYNALVTDGHFGLLASDGSASFDSFTVMTDDPAFAGTASVLPSISVSDATVTEGDNGTQAVTLTFTLSVAAGEPVTVDYATLDGAATAADADYLSANGTLTFTPGETSHDVTFTVPGDTAVEGDESFTVELSNAVGAAIADGSGRISIENNDINTTPALPTLSVTDVSVQEGDKTNKTKAIVTVRLSEASTLPVTVKLATENGTAVSWADYVAAETTLTFAAGETAKQYTLVVNGDKIGEPDEWFGVHLLAAAGATITDDLGVVTIVNDDGAAMVAALPATGDQPVEPLTGEALAPIVDEAVSRWTGTLAIDAAAVAALQTVDFQIVDFTGLTLGITEGSIIFIDSDAAGYGWFVDQTPADDLEFVLADGAAAGRMDLLTVVMHELGHVLGYEDLAAASNILMSEALSAGVRYLPSDFVEAIAPGASKSTLLHFAPPSNGIPSGWIFENGSVADDGEVDGFLDRIRRRVMGNKKHDVLPVLLRIQEMASAGSMENGGAPGAMISMDPADQAVGDEIWSASAGQLHNPWVGEFLLDRAGKADPNRGISIKI
jgi:Ca2+-binding RTX toxin-like protein